MAHGLTIPSTRPRLWLNADRLTAATTYVASNPFTPSGQNYDLYAFSWLTTGNTSHRDTAKNWLLNYTDLAPPISGGDRDQARWFGEMVCLVYDWLHDQFTSGELETLRDRWNTNFAALRTDGAVQQAGLYANNYYWGYVRNEILWGIAIYDEDQTSADDFLDFAFDTKWEAIKTFYTTTARGGEGPEGIQYGRYPSLYLSVPAETCARMGRDLYAELDWFGIQNAWYSFYNSTPAATYLAGAGPQWEILPFNDNTTFHDQATLESEEIGQYLETYKQWNGASAVVSRALHKLTTDAGTASRAYIKAFTPAITPLSDYTALSKDFYSPGTGTLISRSAWDTTSALCRVMMGPRRVGVSHNHGDYGDITIWRNGRWLTRETSAYTPNILASYNEGETSNVGPPTILHNCILVNPQTTLTPVTGYTNNGGMVIVGPSNGEPTVDRCESGTYHAYISSDLSTAYRNNVAAPSRPERDNSAVVHVEREVLWIKPLETAVVMDRVESTSTQRKTIIFHSETEPVEDDANNTRFVVGDQTLHITSLLPASPSVSVVDESSPASTGSSIGQYRLQIEQDGAAQQYFLTVLQARATSTSDLTIAYDGSGATHVVNLSHESLGYARVEFGKGMASAGGGFRYSDSALPGAVDAFRDDVQIVTVTADGVEWEGGPGTEPPTPPRLLCPQNPGRRFSYGGFY
jgi:hypothetical protein